MSNLYIPGIYTKPKYIPPNRRSENYKNYDPAVEDLLKPVKIETTGLKSYFVTMEEGAGFSLDSGIEFLSTQGLCGCVALMLNITKNNKQYIFLSHIESDTKQENIIPLLSSILLIINNIDDNKLYWSDFSNKSDNKIYLAAVDFNGLLIRKLIHYLIFTNASLKYIICSRIAFYIENSVVSVVVPSDDIKNLTYIGKRQFGYGPTNIENYINYKNYSRKTQNKNKKMIIGEE